MLLYDTASRSLREFVPLVPGQVTIYLCGATVQSPPHVGHIRSGLNFDILGRWLAHEGSRVIFVRNVTDIDDKIIAKGAEQGVPYWQVAMTNERAFARAYDVLGCEPPTYEPRATGHIPEMVVLMQRLIDAGHAYAVGGNVWFSVASWSRYGELSGQRPGEMLASADGDASGKRDPRDFALWKAAKPGEPQWETPWGPGRPGWHIECSAMASKYLGSDFDIHGGGLDLVFPHHENELAQSCAAGDGFAGYWMHNAWVTASGEKMSKSLGNSLLVSEVVQRVRPIELRYYLGSAHYRSTIEFSFEALEESAVGFRRIESFIRRAIESGAAVADGSPADVPEAFRTAMNDDLGVPQALAVLHDTVREGNAALDAGDADRQQAALDAVMAMVRVLGVDPLSSRWAAPQSSAARQTIDRLVAGLLDERAAARTRRDFAAADAIRDRLADAGVVIEDTPAGPRWSVGGV